ncbi:MFS transporter [Curtobacterium herbarum]|nr:MFS transporter [Curtobacterium herbarum]MCS6544895.1 MFS transporter [Curtobacterium herbarum]
MGTSSSGSARFARKNRTHAANDSVQPTVAESAAPGTSQGHWRDTAEGFRFCVRDPLFRLVVALVLVTNLLDAARSNALLPLYADERLGGAQALGLVTGTFGGAAFIGSVVFGYVSHRVPRRLTFTPCFVLAGGPSLLVPALGLGLPWMLGSVAVSGVAGESAGRSRIKTVVAPSRRRQDVWSSRVTRAPTASLMNRGWRQVASLSTGVVSSAS